MRLPFTIDIESRDGSSSKDARMKNMLIESDGADKIASVRPGITQTAITTSTAVGQGVNCFNGTFCAIYGAKLYKPVIGTMGTGVAITSASTTAAFDFAQSPT